MSPCFVFILLDKEELGEIKHCLIKVKRCLYNLKYKTEFF